MSSAIVRGEMLAHETAELVVAQIVDVVEIFEIARHGMPGSESFPGAALRLGATPAQNKYDRPRVTAGLFVQNDFACVALRTGAPPPVGVV